MMTSHVGSPHDESDVPLLARMRSGDTAALDLLLRQYWAPLVTYSGRLLNSHDMAEDVGTPLWVGDALRHTTSDDFLRARIIDAALCSIDTKIVSVP